jgi:hypothetical protein
MSSHTAKKCLEIGSQELEITMYFEYEKGEAYAPFQEMQEPPKATILESTAQTLHNGQPRGKAVPVNLGAKTERMLENWLLEHPERWE